MRKIAISLILIGAIAAGCTNQPAAVEALAPSEAEQEVLNKLNEQRGRFQSREDFYQARRELAAEQLQRIDATDLSAEEELVYGRLLAWAERNDEAEAIYNALAKGSDLNARKASIQLMDLAAETENFDKLEAEINRFRQRFKPTPEHAEHLFEPVMALAYHYEETGENAKAAQAIIDEVNSLNLDAPYRSFNLLAYFSSVFDKAGMQDEYLKLLEEHSSELNMLLDARRVGRPENTDSHEFDAETQQFERIAKNLNSARTQMKLVGKPAPDFTFIKFYNGEPVTLADLRGKVVMIDFWANWCGPCKEAFPGMRKIYDQLKDRGFVILGVTSLQSSFRDGDISEQEIDAEREYELTESFIERHEMNWPIGFSDRSCFDPEYGVTGIPTFAIVDKRGIVRKIQVGSGSEEDLKGLLLELLAE